MILSRLNPITEAVRSRPRQIEWVLFDSGRHDRRINDLKRLCREAGVSVRYGEAGALGRLARASQGAVARLAVRGYLPEEEALAGAKGARFLLVLDEIQDPQNLGAVLRVAEGLGARVVAAGTRVGSAFRDRREDLRRSGRAGPGHPRRRTSGDFWISLKTRGLLSLASMPQARISTAWT